MEYYLAIKNKDIMNFAGKWIEYNPEWGNPEPKGNKWYILIYKWILAIKKDGWGVVIGI